MLRSQPPALLWRIKALTRLISLGMILTGSWLFLGALWGDATGAHGSWERPASTTAFLSAAWIPLGVMLYRVCGRLERAWAKEIVTWVMASIILGALARASFGLKQASWPWVEFLAISVELTLPTLIIIGIAKVRRYG